MQKDIQDRCSLRFMIPSFCVPEEILAMSSQSSEVCVSGRCELLAGFVDCVTVLMVLDPLAQRYFSLSLASKFSWSHASQSELDWHSQEFQEWLESPQRSTRSLRITFDSSDFSSNSLNVADPILIVPLEALFLLHPNFHSSLHLLYATRHSGSLLFRFMIPSFSMPLRDTCHVVAIFGGLRLRAMRASC